MTDRRSLETDQVVQQMKQLAARYHAKRLSLFGSRARGDAGPGSDYDFALWGVPKDLRVSLRAGAEDIPSLLKLDLVFISDTVTPEFLANTKGRDRHHGQIGKQASELQARAGAAPGWAAPV